ncbi:AAA ATPase domain-containing protein [Heterostelium album PN500]|uniref:AAA ATPase domain-containing protein n=1 Tax=Heterostelium pallidum (strain ATCC 26659 / Pp 5 / PN500) TaxID=670386 RepID=D3B4K7_HETP5|nr:AAA ATPase domain-containing protein [Heterostelium album PN500]EFA84255.1 AAA ATPase domain-containing protein [Heterostelium album PN500]|eukprot:XP_020436371.1 AAA ATPase domain-containing protein [Heterostelium album PN500]
MDINSFDDTAYQVFYKRITKPNLKLGVDQVDTFIENNPLIVINQTLQQQQQQQTFNKLNINNNFNNNNSNNSNNSNNNIIYKRGGVIEINGSSGTGKSECALHIVVQSILPNNWPIYESNSNSSELVFGGNEIGVVYFDNDYKFDLERLRSIILLKFNHCLTNKQHQIAEKIKLQKDKDSSSTPDELFIQQLDINDSSSSSSACYILFEKLFNECLSRLYIYKCKDSVQFISTLNALPHLIKSVGKEVRDGSAKREIQLVVIDSVSSFYWLDKQGESLGSRLGQLVGLDLFHQIISQYQLTVIGIKQSIFKEGTNTTPNFNNNNNHQITKPPLPKNDFLGPQWSRLVKYRIKLETKYNIDNIFNIDNRPQIEFKSQSLSISRI